MDPAFLMIAELNRLYGRHEVSPVEVTRGLLDRIATYDGELHSFIRVTPEVALAEAAAAERELMAGRHRGPMHGIPYALKDIVETAGIPTTGHSKLCQDYVPSADAHLVTLLKAGGAVLMGKLATWDSRSGARAGTCPGHLRATPGTSAPCPVVRPAAPGRRSRRALSRLQSAQIRAGRSVGRRRSAASPD